jgi:isopenicillin N synthase-like dioxygenase
VTSTLPATDAVDEHGYVPVVSLAAAHDPQRREKIARHLGDALRRSGFYIVVDHDVPRELFDEFYAAALAFFRQPAEVKQEYGPLEGDLTRRGWTTRFRASAGIGLDTDEDAAEAWTMNPYDPTLGWRNLVDLDPGVRSGIVHRNRFPPVRGFRAVLPYFLAMESQILTLLALHATDLGLPTDYFARLCDQSLTNLAANYYPRQQQTAAAAAPDSSCLGPHTDLGIMTALMHSGQRGLQVIDQEHPDRWVPVPNVPGGIVVNAGDELVLVSGGRYRSAYHRVVCPDNEERVSVPVFMQPGPDRVITPACPPPLGESGYEPLDSWEFFTRRMGIMYEGTRH